MPQPTPLLRWTLPARAGPATPVRARLTPHAGLVTFLAVLVPLAASASIPVLVPVQGVVRSADGTAAPAGVYKLTFALYGKADAKTALWTEGPVPVEVKRGVFSHTLGSLKPIAAALVAKVDTAWLGVKVDAGAELPRRPLRAALLAVRAAQADRLACSGCIDSTELATNAVAPKHLSFAYAASKIKGGPAERALDLSCTACVSVGELKFDDDVQLGSHALHAAKLTAKSISAGEIVAVTYTGDGSKLTGIQTVSGECKTKGRVVRGVRADGSLICVDAMDSAGLPPDGLDEISGGLLSNEFDYNFASANTPLPILDNYTNGFTDKLTVPDVGVVIRLEVKVKLSNSNVGELTLNLFDPKGHKYLLRDQSGSGTTLQATYPSQDKPKSGDLASWVGANAKGLWQLQVIDHKSANKQHDGAIESWSIDLRVRSNARVAARARIEARDGIRFGKTKTACTPALAGTVTWDGQHLVVCNGAKAYPITVGMPGTAQNPAGSCLDIRDRVAGAPTAEYWIDPDGFGGLAPFKAWCDMEHRGGGWIKVSEFAETYYRNLPVVQRNAIPWTEVLMLEYDHGLSPPKYSREVTMQTCNDKPTKGFLTTANKGHCSTGIQVRIGGAGGSCGGDDNGCFGVYKGKVQHPWGCNWNCSPGAVTIWGKGYNCNGCRCRNAPYTHLAGCGNTGNGAGTWGKLRFWILVR